MAAEAGIVLWHLDQKALLPQPTAVYRNSASALIINDVHVSDDNAVTCNNLVNLGHGTNTPRTNTLQHLSKKD